MGTTMRNFRLYNYNRTSSFLLSGASSDSIYVTDVEGLGTNFNNNYETSRFRRYITNSHLEFDDISLTIVFGVKNNAYVDYNNLMNFISQNGNNDLILQYGVNPFTSIGDAKFANVRLKNAPRTQRETTNTMQVKFTFTRLTPWYKYTSVFHSTTYTFHNNFLESVPLDIKIYGKALGTLTLTLTPSDSSYKTINIYINPSLNNSSEYIELDADLKKVTLYKSGAYSNGYDLINHTGDSFIFIPPGTSTLTLTSSVSSDSSFFEFTDREVSL